MLHTTTPTPSSRRKSLAQKSCHDLSAAHLVNSSPVLPVLGKKQFKCYVQTFEDREAGRRRSTNKRKRDRDKLVSRTVRHTKPADDHYEAIENFVMSPDHDSDPPAVRRAVHLIREAIRNGEEWDADLEQPILAFELDEALNRWKRPLKK